MLHHVHIHINRLVVFHRITVAIIIGWGGGIAAAWGRGRKSRTQGNSGSGWFIEYMKTISATIRSGCTIHTSIPHLSLNEVHTLGMVVRIHISQHVPFRSSRWLSW